jgi:hypothetical protein
VAGFGLLFGASLPLLVNKSRPLYLKPEIRPEPLTLANVRRTSVAAKICTGAITLLMLGIATGFIPCPVHHILVWLFAGSSLSATIILLFPSQSPESYVADHNEWLTRMNPR